MYSSSEKKLDILNDHYKDTFSHLVSYRKQRDRLLLYLLGVVLIMFLYELATNTMRITILELVSEKTGTDSITLIVLFSLEILLVMCGLVLGFRYWQVWHLIEIQYDYVEKLETELASLFASGVPFTRESNFSYKGNHLSIWSNIFYDLSFTVLFFSLCFLNMISIYRLNGFSWIWLFVCIIWIIVLSFWCFKILRSRTH